VYPSCLTSGSNDAEADGACEADLPLAATAPTTIGSTTRATTTSATSSLRLPQCYGRTVAGQATGDMDADRRRPYTRRMRFPGRPSGEATVFELIVWASLLTLLFPLVALVLLFRYRVLQAIVAGYREGASPAGPAEP
jgi:hypothetical protein